MQYPRIVYHKQEAPEGQLVRNAGEEPKGEGWVTTPEAFDPAYVPPPPEAPGAPARRPGYVPKPYPCVKYARTGDAKKVLSAEDEALLEAREPGVWAEHPDGPWSAESQPAAPPVPAPVAPSPASPSSPAAVASFEAEAVYAATVPVLAEQIAKVSTTDILDRIRLYEDENPKGPRRGVFAALASRYDELKPKAEGEDA